MDYLGMKYKFESAIGLNGRVWIKAASLASTLLISNTLNKLQHTSEKQIVSEFQFWSWTILGLLLINVNRCKVYIVNRLSSISSMVFVSQNLCVYFWTRNSGSFKLKFRRISERIYDDFYPTDRKRKIKMIFPRNGAFYFGLLRSFQAFWFSKFEVLAWGDKDERLAENRRLIRPHTNHLSSDGLAERTFEMAEKWSSWSLMKCALPGELKMQTIRPEPVSAGKSADRFQLGDRQERPSDSVHLGSIR